MSLKRKAKGPKLPDTLQEKLVDVDDDRKFEKRFTNRAQSRKEQRRQGRIDKKKKKTQRIQVGINVQSPAKRQKTNQSQPSTTKIISDTNKLEKLSTTNPNFYSLLKDSNLVFSNKKILPESKNVDDKELKRLEKKLGIKSRGKLTKAFEEDGLDELLQGFEIGSKNSKKSNSILEENEEIDMSHDDDEEQNDFNVFDETESDDENSDNMEEESDVERESESKIFKKQGKKCNDNDQQSEANEAKDKYIPPHMQRKTLCDFTSESDDAKKEQQIRLQRQLQGLLNRLSESNIESIIINVEELYQKFTRHDVTSSITSLVLNLITSRSTILDQFVIIYATLVAAFYKIIGIDFCAYFVQKVIEEFERYHKQYSSTSDDVKNLEREGGKECTNLIVLISELYNFQVISCVLIYDLIRIFITDLNELNVELLLKIVRSSGYQLRQDDPTALKEIIQQVQTETSKKDPRTLGSRWKFMIETILNLKNNRVKQQDFIANTENVLRMKKFLNNLGKRIHVQATEALRVGLDDIKSIETKGKWWLVGSSWTANMVDDPSTSTFTQRVEKIDKSATEALLKLAKEQKMNTDIRRSIFVVTMSSEDYIDAFERLLKLNLKEVQEREIPRVLLLCCGNEKTYNPYYALISQKLCEHDHSYKITFQYCLWDFLRECGESDIGGMELVKNTPSTTLENIPLRRIVNLSKFYALLLTGGQLSIIILKDASNNVYNVKIVNFREKEHIRTHTQKWIIVLKHSSFTIYF
ncbi:11174_t:CDS:10 [Funneliformis geosporum]|uniref:2183_t:CDS:1 n=1 Tax=Funneliformis geosporum TaxID=1117311 RepID=A0A9W4WS46_9GLOM|nr:11174_t:CDS:10 [Funneliformis geosporum]CAI2168034.1 2183_t:CDS:10 [Funneliformis geosporum]